MSSITAEELGLLREEAQVWYPDRCDVFTTPADVDDAFGGRTPGAEVPKHTNEPCMVESGAAHTEILTLMGQQRLDQLYILTMRADLDIDVGDRIVVTTKGNLNLSVQAVLAPESFEIDRRVVTNEI